MTAFQRFDCDSGAVLASSELHRRKTDCVLSPSGRLLAVAVHGIRAVLVHDVRSTRGQPRNVAWLSDMCGHVWHPDSRLIAGWTEPAWHAKVVNAFTGEIIWTGPQDGRPRLQHVPHMWSRTGAYLCMKTCYFDWSDCHSICGLLDMTSQHPVFHQLWLGGGPGDFCFSPDRARQVRLVQSHCLFTVFGACTRMLAQALPGHFANAGQEKKTASLSVSARQFTI